MNAKNIWPAVILVCVLVEAVALVLIFRPEAISYLNNVTTLLAVPLLGALLGLVNQVRHQTNGNTSELIETIRRQNEVIASMGGVPDAGAGTDR